MIRITDLRYSYDGKTFLTFPDITLKEKEDLLIIGPSGVGKTTLLHLLAGLLRPTEGEISIDNKDITRLSGAALDHFRGQNIGLVFQTPHFIKSLNVLENLKLVQRLPGTKKNTDRPHELLDRLGLSTHKTKKTYQLSQGQQQRLSIALALVNGPKVILADEPTSSLDDQNCNEVTRLLKDQAIAEAANLIIITHDARLKSDFSNQITL